MTFFEFFFSNFRTRVRSNQENDPGNVVSTPDLTIKHVHHTQFWKVSIFKNCQFSKKNSIFENFQIFEVFFPIFRTRVRSNRKNNLGFSFRTQKIIQNDILHGYIWQIFKKSEKSIINISIDRYRILKNAIDAHQWGGRGA